MLIWNIVIYIKYQLDISKRFVMKNYSNSNNLICSPKIANYFLSLLKKRHDTNLMLQLCSWSGKAWLKRGRDTHWSEDKLYPSFQEWNACAFLWTSHLSLFLSLKLLSSHTRVLVDSPRALVQVPIFIPEVPKQAKKIRIQ